MKHTAKVDGVTYNLELLTPGSYVDELMPDGEWDIVIDDEPTFKLLRATCANGRITKADPKALAVAHEQAVEAYWDRID